MVPKITVIMPSLNVASYISECLESVLNQTLKELEILCIDAGSTDGTYEILQSYAGRDERIKVIYSDRKSYGYQVNLGIRLASAEYIGIVETDDYIETQMYEKLYDIIETEKVDYVKANFDSFRILKSGERVFLRNKLFKKDELYNKKIYPNAFLKIIVRDQALWKGIYRKSFLRDNQIELSETAGAAYQDIGFALQVVIMAKQAIYVPESYYRYRLERKESSSYSLKVLNNCYFEYNRLLPIIKGLNEKCNGKAAAGYYTRMSFSFLGEYKKILIAEDFHIDTEYLTASYQWFKKQLNFAIENGSLNRNEMIETIWDELLELLEDEESFRDKLRRHVYEKKVNDKVLIEKLSGKEVIVFGSGNWGKEALIWLDQSDISAAAFCDNNKNLWGQAIADVPIRSPERILREYPFAYYVIANKQYMKEIQRQLLDAGINKEQIVKYLR